MKTKTLILSLALALPAPWCSVQAADAPARPAGAQKDGERKPGPRDGEQPKQGGPRDGQRPPGPMGMPFLHALDKDQDGIISADEIKNSSDSLKALDKNKDGKLTRDEWQPQPPQGEGGRRAGQRDGDRPKGAEGDATAKATPGRRQAGDKPAGDKPAGDKPPGDGQRRGERPPPPPLLEALDTDGDGVISADEIGKAPESLAKLDKNGDGQLGPGEYGPRPPQGGPRDGGKDGEKPERKAAQ